MTKRDLTDAELDTLFAAARRGTPEPDPAFLSRLADAAEQSVAPQPVPRPAQANVLVHLRQLLGGWTGLAGLATATVAGFWIGVAPPQGLAETSDLLALFASDTGLSETWFDAAAFDSLLQEEL